MSEKIEVRYQHLGLGVYHKYIVYTNSAGEEFIARGGPYQEDRALAGLYEPALDGGWVGPGQLVTRFGRFDPFDDSYAENKYRNSDMRVTVAEGPGLSGMYDRITESMMRTNGQYPYGYNNSNSTVNTAVVESGGRYDRLPHMLQCNIRDICRNHGRRRIL